MKKIFTHLFVAVLLMLSSASWAQFENGKVYRIVCSGTSEVSLGASALSDVAAVSTSVTDKSQQWYVTTDGSNYTFRNLSNGRYLQGNAETSKGWSLTEESNDFTVTLVSGNYCIRQEGHTNGYAYMHKDAGNNIVSWESGAANSQWTPIEVSYTDEQLAAVWAEVESLVVPSATVASYEEKLSAIFTDNACTQLNSTYAGMSDSQIQNDDNYKALPATLQAMVLKVKGDNWSENNAITGKEGWSDDYAKRFRVQMYEPYSIEGEITSYLRFNAHCNMDNPTGIYANSGEPIYIMVDGDIADGAELWVAHQTGLGATSYYNNASHTQLHKGLNIVPYFNDASVLWINYVVHTYNSSGATIQEKFPENRRLSQYKPLKIHIEGGYINGYYNAMGDYRATAADGSDNLWGEVDNDEDWDYYKVRAPLNGTDAPNRDFPLLGHRQTLLFPLGQQANDGGGMENGLLYHLDNITVPTVPNCYGGSGNTFGSFDGSYSGMNLDASNGKINIMIEAWDRIMYSELATMGLVSTSTMDKMNALYPRWTTDNEPAEIYDYNGKSSLDSKTYKEFCQGVDYSEYFNHHGAAVGSPSGYMSGGWRVCNYHYNTMGSIIGKIANEAGPTWGPAHEIGHQHQGVFNLNGQTEVTNNFFSNVAVWYMGMGTSRVNGNDGSLNNLLSLFNNEDVNQYLHMTQGGNIWALTHLYYRLWLYYHLAGNNTQFWPRLFELCRQTPLENGTQISGETSLLRFYQHACDAAGEDLTEFFRAHGYFDVMDNVYVGDYTNATYNMTEEQIDAAIKSVKDKGYPVNYAALLINDATSETTVKHDGATKRSLWDDNATADLGSVNDFIDGDIETLTNYTATVSADRTVTMSGGEGGIGFLVLNEDGELVSFSNKTEFALNDEAAYLLATGKATIVAVDTDSKTAEAEVDITALQANLLSELISTVEALPMETDNSFTHVGFYTTPATESLRAALAAAKETAETGVGLQAAYELLYKEYTVLKESDPASVKVQLDPSLTYIVTNKAYPARTMTVVNNVVYANTGVDTTADAAKWQFKETATAGVYNVYNCSGIYCGTISGSTAVTTTTEQASAKNYTVDDLGNGLWAISLNPAGTNTQFHAAANDSYKIVGWSSGAIASQWYITAVEANADAKATAELQALIEKTENLVGTLATIENKYDEIVLQADKSNENYYILCNNPDTQEGGGVKALLDNDNSTYLHSNWHSLSSSNDYLQVNLGTGNELDLFRITGVQRTGASTDFPKIIEIKGSTDNQSWTTIATVKDLPQSATSSWERDVISVKSYPYLRFIVTTGKNENMAEGERPYFHMAEFSIFKTVLSATLLDAYAEYSSTLTSSLIADAYNGVELGKAWLDYDNATSDELTTYTATLQGKYDALYAAYKKVIDAEKAKLQSIIDDTEGLITQVGTATVTADAKISLLGRLYAERPYTAGGTSHSDYSSATNGYNLLDGNSGTHFHSDYNYSTMVSPPYIRVDLGEGNSAAKFKFNYRTRSQTGCAPKTIEVYGGNAVIGVSRGDIMGSTALNSVTTATKIVIKNLASDNSRYLAGTSNEENIADAVLVWEPVVAGEAGRYYLRTAADAEKGYFQANNGTEANVILGAKATAQVFVTTAPTSDGANSTLCNAIGSLQNADTGNLVRFVQEGQEKWLNCQGESSTPKLGNEGKGVWTVHNVYTVVETTVPEFETTPLATFTSQDANNPLPLTASTDWTSGEIASNTAYRYIKFSVTDSEGSKQENGVKKYYFAISEFGFNKVGEESATINAKYNGIVSEELLIDTRRTVNASETMADYAADYVVTVEQIKAQTAAQQAAYDALNEAMVATADKSELEALIEATTILKGQLYETVITSYEANEVTLSITEGDAGYIYCNAPEKNSTWATDNAGVAALIDLTDGNPNLETFLHTEYGNDQSEDGLDHYLRVDLGADGATDYIEFGYYGRSGHVAKSPKKVIVAATNDLTDGGVWTEIATLNLAQASASTETKTGCLGNGVEYRYWRFLVEETHGGGKDGNNHQFFCMTQFNVYKCTEIVKDEQLKYSPTIYIYTTTELVTEVENAISAATTVKDDTEALQPAVDAAVEALQAVYDKLAEAINYYWCPVELTVDVANPALYIIDAIGRGEGKAWQYNAQNNNITIVNKDASNLYHLWYFMLGGEEQTVKIIPVMTPEYGLSATDFTNGINKVSAVAENCVNWSFAYVNNNYNFKPHGRNIYLSNYNGGSNPLGFYGSTDGGSYVNFTAVEVEDYALTRLAKLAEGKSVVTAGTTVGSYDEATCGVYNEALEAANGMVAAASSMPQDYVNAFTRLFNANNGLRINLPDPAKFYALRCNHESRYIYVNADNKLQWASSSYDKAQSRAVWQFEEIDASNGTCKMKSLHTQSYLSGTSDSQWTFGEEGKVVTLVKSPSVEGALVFKVDGYENNGLHAHGENNTVISHTNDADANHYFFEEVEVVTGIKHDVTMKTKFSSVTLGYNATVPAGVEAYNAVGLDDGYVSLVKVEGEVIPANTPVILYRTDGDSEAKTFTFTYTDKTAEKPASTLLGGSLYTKYVQCDDSDYYKLMIKNGEAKMYLMYKEFNAAGVSQGETHAGGHIKCSANKIYMRVPAASGAASYGMRFIDYGTTDIDDFKGENGDAKAIYDLQGRKLTEITEPGIYIVNGKKVYVK